jgi:predicted O-methyltransferase YrrM
MTDLLIHSMTEFADLILQCLDRAGARDVAEIGAEFGGMSQCLADHCAAAGGSLTSIDPAPKAEFVEWAASCPHVRHVAAPSLEAMPALANIDAWMIDGDHNYYTVFNELRLADAASRRDGKPLLAVLHDVAWPCARRDMYYAPETIPAEHRHAHSFEGGVTLGNDGVLLDRGMRGMGNFAWALRAGGPRNGVLTAIEDFIEQAQTEDRLLLYAEIPAVFGLGVLFDAGAEWAEDVAGILLPYHQNDLIASLERNRLRNYLAVIDWQDRHAAGRAA